MTSLERCMAVLDERMPDTLPVVPQSFMFAVETAGYKIGEVNRNGRKMAEAHIVSQEKYGYDGCVIDFDDATIAEAVGAKVIFCDDEPAIVDEQQPVLKDLRDVYDMPIPDPMSSGLSASGSRPPSVWSRPSATMSSSWDAPTRAPSASPACCAEPRSS